MLHRPMTIRCRFSSRAFFLPMKLAANFSSVSSLASLLID